MRFSGRFGGPGAEVHQAGVPARADGGEAGGADPAVPRYRSRRPSLVREVALVAGLFLVYRLGRLAITGHDQIAVSNAWWVWDVERTLRLPDEELLQQWVLQWPDLLKAANWYYVGVHFPLTAAFLVWGWLKRPPEEYRYARRLLSLVTGLALIVHVVMPLAPPRMLHRLGFLDTMAVFGPSAYGDSTATIANQFAAMPSLHVGWALLIAVVVIRTARTPLRWVAVLHPTITVLVVVATANHYWVDAIAAGLLLLVALVVVPQPYAPSPLSTWRTRRRLAPAVASAGAGGAPDGWLVASADRAPVGADVPDAGSVDGASAVARAASPGGMGIRPGQVSEPRAPSRSSVMAGCPKPRPPAD